MITIKKVGRKEGKNERESERSRKKYRAQRSKLEGIKWREYRCDHLLVCCIIYSC